MLCVDFIFLTVFCADGWQVIGDNQCEPCPKGTYKDSKEDVFSLCTPCPLGYTTAQIESTSRYDCKIGIIVILVSD